MQPNNSTSRFRSITIKRYCTSTFFAVLFTVAKIWKQPKWLLVNKENVVYVFKGSYSALKRKNFATAWMNLESIVLSETSETQKIKCHVISFISGILKKKKGFMLLVTRRRMVVTKCSSEEKTGILSKDTDFIYKTNKFRDLI